MRIPAAVALLLCLGVFAVLTLPPSRPRVRVAPKRIVSLNRNLGTLDSIAVVGSQLWITDKGNGSVLVVAPETGRVLRVLAAPAVPFRMPNGIAAAAESPPAHDAAEGGNHMRVFVADTRLGEIIALSPSGALVGRFGKKVLVHPAGISAYAQQGAYHVYVTDQRDADTGSLWHLTVKHGKEQWRFVGSIRGEVESVWVVPERNLAVVADETHRHLLCMSLTDGTVTGRIGVGVFRGEPEGLIVSAERGPCVVALDQTSDATLLLFGPGRNEVRQFASMPPLVDPDGLCLGGDSLFVVSNNRLIFEFSLSALR